MPIKKKKPVPKKKPVKKAVKKSTKRKAKETLAGKVLHYFDKINVAVMKLSVPLKQGDEIRIVGGKETDFTQAISSMQVDYKPIKKAKKGDEVGLKVKEKVHEGYKIYKV